MMTDSAAFASCCTAVALQRKRTPLVAAIYGYTASVSFAWDKLK